MWLDILVGELQDLVFVDAVIGGLVVAAIQNQKVAVCVDGKGTFGIDAGGIFKEQGACCQVHMELGQVVGDGIGVYDLAVAVGKGDHGRGVAVEPPDPYGFAHVNVGNGRGVGHIKNFAVRLCDADGETVGGGHDAHLLGADAGFGLLLDFRIDHGF